MQTTQELTKEFGRPGLTFTEADGLSFIEISTDQAEAKVCLQGAHLMSWRPISQERPVVWLSREARPAPGKSIRGGVPVCWPWFGPHETDSSYPAHGFARTTPWELIGTSADPGGSVSMDFRLLGNEASRKQWPQPSVCELKLRIGETLRVELITENTGSESFPLSEALHTYFEIGDIGRIQVLGLEDAKYLDKVGEPEHRSQVGPIEFSGEVDRVYLDTDAVCVIEDSLLKRRIRVEKSGAFSTVVWTPWAEKAAKMGDMGAEDGWRQMVCVESGNALDNTVMVGPGGKHVMSATYSVAPLS